MCVGPCTVFGSFLQDFGIYVEIVLLILASVWIYLDKTRYNKMKPWQRTVVFIITLAIILSLILKTPQCGCIENIV